MFDPKEAEGAWVKEAEGARVKEAEGARVKEASEEKLLDLQNSIQRVERKLRLAETEKKADSLQCNSNVKKNELEIRRLKMEVQELEACLERRQKADENVMSKEFQKKFRDFGKFTGKSAKEVRRQLDAEAIELQRKSKSLRHELELKARTLRHNKEQYEEMTSNCDAYFETEPTEYHSLQVTKYSRHSSTGWLYN
ncbi:hypothetical protein AVEN_69553-1 [Araneus ventricosus]|uniref:Uncharacterized protein n=1 Tax=Araneus ventricosus TaxID=182803 RepID=A0A4Y2TGN1_ARAVE|nr:hypothetical protein AVEN_69553-1 [Araneus ventricosus]